MAVNSIPYSQFLAQDSILSTSGGPWHCSGFANRSCLAHNAWFTSNQPSISSSVQAEDPLVAYTMLLQVSILVDLTSIGNQFSYNWSFFATSLSDQVSGRREQLFKSSLGDVSYRDFIPVQDVSNTETWANASYVYHTGDITLQGNSTNRTLDLSLEATLFRSPSEFVDLSVRNLHFVLEPSIHISSGAAALVIPRDLNQSIHVSTGSAAPATASDSISTFTGSAAPATASDSINISSGTAASATPSHSLDITSGVAAPAAPSDINASVPSPDPSTLQIATSSPTAGISPWIIGCAVACSVLLILLTILAVLLWKRRKRLRRISLSKVRNVQRPAPLLTEDIPVDVVNITAQHYSVITPFHPSQVSQSIIQYKSPRTSPRREHRRRERHLNPPPPYPEGSSLPLVTEEPVDAIPIRLTPQQRHSNPHEFLL